jgi:sulfate transport system substrate-binding protein
LNPARRTILGLLIGILALAAGVAGACGEDDSSGGVSLVAYSTPEEAYGEIIPAFKDADQGAGAGFKQSYGASGDQARAVAAGLDADVVALSLAPDVDKLVEAKKVPATWTDDEHDGFVTNSVVVFAVRKGNPENIRTWDDLTREDLDVITPNPFTSGGAKWNIMAAYGAKSDVGKGKQAGEDYLRALFENVSVQSKSAREALQTFVGGKGDVLISYENEAITAQQKDQDIDYIVPDDTILIQNPIAVTATGGQAAKDFVEFTRSDEAQKIFSEKGYRTVKEDVPGARTFPDPPGLFDIDDLGGWPSVNREFFDPDNGLMADINRSLGQSTD